MRKSKPVIHVMVLACTTLFALTAEEVGIFRPLLQELSTDVDERTLERIETLEDLAVSFEWARLGRQAEKLGEALAREGKRDSRVFGLVSAYRAIAAAETGNVRDAEWHWQAALNQLQGVSKDHLSAVTQRSSLLLNVELPPYRQPQEEAARAQRPNLLEGVAPNFLLGRGDRRRAPFAATLQYVIRTDGTSSSPRVLPPHTGAWAENGDVIYSTLEAVRRWRHAPVTIEGQVVEHPSAINVSFGLGSGRMPPNAKRLHKRP